MPGVAIVVTVILSNTPLYSSLGFISTSPPPEANSQAILSQMTHPHRPVTSDPSTLTAWAPEAWVCAMGAQHPLCPECTHLHLFTSLITPVP